jgi:hypothetical protein
MNTMQTALKQALAGWDTPAQPPVDTKPERVYYFKPSNRVTEYTFEAVKNNPGKTRKEIVAILDTQGFSQSSTSSLLSMMVKNGLIAQHQTTGHLHALTDTYRPLKKMTKTTKGLKKGPKPKGVVTKEVVRVMQATTPVPTAQPVSELAYTAEDIMQRITMSEGKKLFRLLSEVFA